MKFDSLFSHHFPSLSKDSNASSFYSPLLTSRCLFTFEEMFAEYSFLMRSVLGQSFRFTKARSPIIFSVYLMYFSPRFVNGRSSCFAVSMLYSTFDCFMRLITFKHFKENTNSQVLGFVSNVESIPLIFVSASSISPFAMRFLISYLSLIICSLTGGTT